MKLSTGVEGLDKFLDGGFEKGSVVMATGIKNARDVYSLQFLKDGIYISTEAVGDVIRRRSEYNFEGRIRFIAVEEDRAFKETKYVESLASLEEISMALSELMAEERSPRISINLVSTFLLYNELERIVKFIQNIIERCKDAGSLLLLVVDKEMHEKKEFETLKELCNAVVDFVRNESGEFVQVRDDCPPSLLEFDIGKRGIVVKEKFL